MIELQHVSKRFGNFNAVSDLSFSLHGGQILSLIGQNGAGKSTTFHMILDFIKPDSGKILWSGKPLTPDAITAKVGYMPEERGLYPKETIKSQLLYFAALHGMKKAEAIILLDDWMKRFNVVGKSTDKIESLSKGNAQKVQLIACLMFKPQLLILDEPFSGLDPVNSELLIKAILAAKQQGTMVIFSTHNMDNVQKLSDYIVMLKHGQTVLKGTPTEIYRQFGRLRLDIEGYQNVERLKRIQGVRNVTLMANGVHLELNNEQCGRVIFAEVTKNGYVPVFNQHYPDLEAIFKYEVHKKAYARL